MSHAFAQIYEQYSDEELLSRHASGTLTDAAYEALENEMRRRGQAVGPRPIEPQVDDASAPVGMRVLGFLGILFALNILWVTVIQNVVRGAIPFLLCVGLPTVVAWRTLFPKDASARAHAD